MKEYRLIIAIGCWLLTAGYLHAQEVVEDTATIRVDSLTIEKPVKMKRDWAHWRPETKRAMWLAIVLPGAGQIYNRKFWKLPIIYGGFVGCGYAWAWNNQMYNDYKQAYLDLVDDDPETKSYEEFIHSGIVIDDSNRSYYETLFSKRKDRFRRYRDLSIFCMIGVYALSVIDAYVDASLSEFDISNDLSLHVQPSYFQGAWGLQCSLTF